MNWGNRFAIAMAAAGLLSVILLVVTLPNAGASRSQVFCIGFALGIFISNLGGLIAYINTPREP